MKKRFPLRIHFLFLLGTFVLTAPVAWTAPDLDRQYQLETIGFLKSWDNVDGLFADYVSSAYQQYFAKQSRFVLVDLSKSDTVLSQSKIPYRQLIDDTDILAQVARSAHLGSLIRTKILKEGHQYQFTLEWLHVPGMELIGSVSFSKEDPKEGGAFGADFLADSLQENLDLLIKKTPILGTVTGRDNSAVTINLGLGSNLKKGDTLIIATVDEVKKHPLLKTIVDWKLSRTGKIVIDQTEEGMAFGKVVEEEFGRQIAKDQKVVQIQKTSKSVLADKDDEEKNESKKREEPPHLGWMAASVLVGSFGRDYSDKTVPVSYSGGGFEYGGNAQAELWLTKSWFANLGLEYGAWNFSQKDTTTGTSTTVSQNGGVSSGLISAKFDIGYSYLITGDFFGPKGWVKLGYKGDSFSLPSSATEYTGPISIGSIFLGIGGDLPIRDTFGIQTNFNCRVFSFVGQNLTNQSVSGVSDIEFYLGGYYRSSPRITVRVGFEIKASGVDFNGGATLSQKTITFAPGLLYYF